MKPLKPENLSSPFGDGAFAHLFPGGIFADHHGFNPFSKELMNLLPMSRILFRPSRKSSFPMPFGVRSTGVHVHAPKRLEKREKHVSILLWCTHGTGRVWLDGTEHELPADHVVLFLQDDLHHWQALTPHWRIRWFTLDGDQADACLRAFDFPRAPVQTGPCPENLFDMLFSLVGDPYPGAEYLASVYAYHILAYARSHFDMVKELSLPARIKSILESHFADPDFGVDRLAIILKMHRSTITRLFSNHYRVTPRKYLINIRLQKALDLLLESQLPITEIALRSGFRDVGYFTRSVTSTFGVPPSELRKQRAWESTATNVPVKRHRSR